MFFGLGFSLEKVAAMQEHGIKGMPTSLPFYQLLIVRSVLQGYMGMYKSMRLTICSCFIYRTGSTLHLVCIQVLRHTEYN